MMVNFEGIIAVVFERELQYRTDCVFSHQIIFKAYSHTLETVPSP